MKCGVCTRPVGDQATVCGYCVTKLERTLGDVPALVHELNTVLSRQSVYVAPYVNLSTQGVEQPLPVSAAASVAAGCLRQVLVSWVLLVSEERGSRVLPGDDTSALAGWLLGEVSWLRLHGAGPEAFEEITGVVDQVRHVVDSPTNRTTFPVGPCPEQDGMDLACRGEVRAYIPTSDTSAPHLACTADPAHRWESHQWNRAGLRIRRRAAWLTVQRLQRPPVSPTGPSAGGSRLAG